MVKVKYNGNMAVGRVKVLGNVYHFEKGQILEMDEKSAKQLTLNEEYERVEEPKISYSRKKLKVEEEINEEDE